MSIHASRKALASFVSTAWDVVCDPSPKADTPKTGDAWIAVDSNTTYERAVSGGRSQATHQFVVVTFFSVIGGSNPTDASQTQVSDRVEVLLAAIEDDVTLGGLFEEALLTKVETSSDLRENNGIDSGARIEIEVIEWNR